MTIVDVPQRSPAWHEARLGRLTGSRAAAMLATIKTGEAAARRSLRVALVLERLTGRSQDGGYQSPAMRDGIAREPDARARYEALTGLLVAETGFLVHETILAGCSLDGHLGTLGTDDAGILELKAPTPAVHLATLDRREVPAEYFPQVLHNLWISGARWCDWLSYSPDFPDRLQAVLIHVERDDQAVAAYASKATAFLEEVAIETARVAQLGAPPDGAPIAPALRA